MSFPEKAFDRSPFIPGAGVPTKPAKDDLDVNSIIKQDIYNPITSETPNNLKKYRQNLARSVGVKQLHPGIYDDNHDYENLVHGNPSADSDHVYQLIKIPYLDGTKNFINNINESKYASNRREPLGRSIVRNYQFPEEVKLPKFRFGLPGDHSMNVKELIYNYNYPMNETDRVKQLYYKTHLVTDPGQQNTRFYDWDKAKINLNDHIFGIKQSGEQDGVKKSMLNEMLKNPYPQTVLVNKKEEDFRQAKNDMLGVGKFFGTLNKRYTNDLDHTYGKKDDPERWNAAKCIYGDRNTATADRVKPDEDLGKNILAKVKTHRSQISIPGGEDRTFGVPTIRSDLVKPAKFKKVNDYHDYGDEPDAFELLYPHPEAIRGVTDEDFDKLYSKEEINTLMKKYDFKIPENEYDTMFNVALKNYPNDEGKISAKSFISTMRNLKREYQKYRNIEKELENCK